MNRHFATATSALSLLVCFAGTANAAIGFHKAAPTTVSVNTSTKVKLVSFHLRNDSGSTITVQVGEQQIVVEAGKIADVKAQEGLQVVAVNASAHFAAGAVLTTVSQSLSGNTLAVS